MSKLIILFSLLIITSVSLRAQVNAITIRGTVTDHQTKQGLIGASIRESSTLTGTQSDLQGKFELNVLRAGKDDSLIVTYVGYKKYAERFLNLDDKQVLQISLTSESTTLKEAVVRSEFWTKQYSPAELKEDYNKFCTIMEKVHTGLYDYFPEAQWRSMKDSVMQLCNYPMSHGEFYRIIALQVGKVRNVHTKHGVTEWWYKQKQNIFPFNIQYFDDRMFVSESLVQEEEFPKGTEILEINGKNPQEIRDMIWPFIPADGFNQTQKLCVLNDYFPWFFSLFVEEADSYTIKLRTLAGQETTTATHGLKNTFAHLSFQQALKLKKSAFEFVMDDRLKTAYFRIEDSRAVMDSLKTYFKRIHDHGIQYLILDIRGEGGIREGEHVTELYSYFVDKPFRAYETLEVKSNDWTLFDKDFSYKPYAKSLKEIREGFFNKLVDSGNGSYLWEEQRLKKLNPAEENNFNGAVYILTDGRNYSASTSFTSLAAQLDNVFIVGEETGGEYRSYVSGAMFPLVLPNSKIIVKVATWKSTLAFPENPANRGHGVMPDYPVTLTLDDFIKGRDVVKEFSFELVSGRK